jgi:hypothetical protein
MKEFCQRVSQGLEQASWEQKRQLIEWLVARVVVTDGEVEIRYVIPTSPAGEAAHFVICVQTIEATMGRYKALIGPRLRARGFPAQQTEAAIGVVVLNRMLAAGRPNAVRVQRVMA